MNVVIPPIINYVIGAALVLFGAARVLMLGRRRPSAEVNDSADSPARTSARRRHLAWGAAWIGMGLFLIISTAMTLRARSPF